MSTGACGINCDVCRLHLNGVCSTCGSGTSPEGMEKHAAQRRILGMGCLLLECAIQRGIAYCTRDCDDFPCDRFLSSNYPYGPNFLAMQKRRREEAGEGISQAWPEPSTFYWKQLRDKHRNEVVLQSGAMLSDGGRFSLQCLNETWSIDPKAETVQKIQGNFGGEWDRQIPYLILVYLAVASMNPVSGQMVSLREIEGAKNFFQGQYKIHTKPLEDCFGRDGDRFYNCAKLLGGDRINQADVAVRFYIFPKLPVDYLFWQADEEFPARVAILLDNSSASHLPPDAITVALNLLNGRLLMTANY